MLARPFYGYIMNSESGTLYISVTNDLARRVREHKSGTGSGFTRSYNIHRLAYYEVTNDVKAAIEREKQIRGWSREKKLALIRGVNPTWRDLSEEIEQADHGPHDKPSDAPAEKGIGDSSLRSD